MSVSIHAQVAAARQRDYERYLAFEAAAELRDELTDASERLAAPMENYIPLFIDSQGNILSEHGQDMKALMDDAVTVAEQAAAMGDDVGPEIERRKIERQLLEGYTDLGEGDISIELSPIPDAVREGRTALGGYDRQRLKMLVRVIQRRADKLDVIHFSLDRSDKNALLEIADEFSHLLPDGLGSEDILRTPIIMTGCRDIAAKEVVDKIRNVYDQSLSRHAGGEWFAGRRPMSIQDAMTFIEEQPDLIEAHMNVIRNLKARTEGADLQRALGVARYDFAAALDRRMDGKEVTDLAEAGNFAREAGRSFNGDCATFSSTPNSIGMAQGAIENGILKCVTCPFCSAIVDARVSQGAISCPSCMTSVDKSGKIRKVSPKPQRRPDQVSYLQPFGGSVAKPSGKKMTNIPYEYVGRRIGMGTAEKLYKHKSTGVIGTASELGIASGHGAA